MCRFAPYYLSEMGSLNIWDEIVIVISLHITGYSCDGAKLYFYPADIKDKRGIINYRRTENVCDDL